MSMKLQPLHYLVYIVVKAKARRSLNQINQHLVASFGFN